MRLFGLISLALWLFLAGCDAPVEKKETVNETNLKKDQIDFQGHRGCRGLYPENTLPGFIHALDLGVTTLEMDVVITKDKKVILSHEPWFSHLISTDSTGRPIDEENERNHAIYQMTFAETQKYDVGQKEHPWFPEQKSIPAQKPLLREVIATADAHAKKTRRPLPYYNIETKCLPPGDRIFHPEPDEFSELLIEVLRESGIEKRAIVQSFDVRTLQYIHKNYPDIKLALLVENEMGPEENLSDLGFTPDVYSPDYAYVNPNLVSFCRERKMELIPWTVNETDEMQNLINMGVDGIISDYPNKFGELK